MYYYNLETKVVGKKNPVYPSKNLKTTWGFAMTEKELPLSLELIRERIYVIRGQKVMLDRDLAELYGVTVKRLNEQVKRNLKRFPEDFMFSLDIKEVSNLKSQIATSSWGGVRKMPNVFTENGVAMLSGILNSDRAIDVNIQIMRTFTKIRELMTIHKDIYQRMNKIEIKLLKHDQSIASINNVIEEMLKLPVTVKRKGKSIGFKKE